MTSTQSIHQSIDEALKMELGGKKQEAYIQYLNCIDILTSNLKTLASNEPTNLSIPTDKMFYFIRESLERCEQLVAQNPYLFKQYASPQSPNSNNHSTLPFNNALPYYIPSAYTPLSTFQPDFQQSYPQTSYNPELYNNNYNSGGSYYSMNNSINQSAPQLYPSTYGTLSSTTNPDLNTQSPTAPISSSSYNINNSNAYNRSDNNTSNGYRNSISSSSQEGLPWSYTPSVNSSNQNRYSSPEIGSLVSTVFSVASATPTVANNNVLSSIMSSPLTRDVTSQLATSLIQATQESQKDPEYYQASQSFKSRIPDKEIQFWGKLFSQLARNRIIGYRKFLEMNSLLALQDPLSVEENVSQTVEQRDCFIWSLFLNFDSSRRNAIRIEDWQHALSVLCYGNPKERAEFSYSMFDPERLGYITRPMFNSTLARVYKLLYNMGLDVFGTTTVAANKPGNDFLAISPSNTSASEHKSNQLFTELFGNVDKVLHDQYIRTIMHPTMNNTLVGLNILSSGSIKQRYFQKSGTQVPFGARSFSKVLNMMLGLRLAQQQTAQSWNMRVYGLGNAKSMQLYPRDCSFVTSFELPRIILPRDVGESVSESYHFRDYAPLVFRNIRARFKVTEEQYAFALSPEQLIGNLLCGKLTSMSEKLTDGRSGNFFFYSDNGNFLCKTISAGELETFLRILPHYYNHMCKFPDTLITRYYGLHCLNDTVFVVMANVFQTNAKMDFVYDLKGSTIGRTSFASEEEAKNATEEQMKRAGVMKDLDWIAHSRTLSLGNLTQQFLDQSTNDAKFLEKYDIIDYSLLVGIRKATSTSIEDAQNPFHQKHDGGILCGNQIIYLGIIDTLIEYGVKKKLEHHLKSFRYGDGTGVSVTDPKTYCTRFLSFVHSITPKKK